MPTEIIDGDYILKDGCGWFEVGGFSIRIRHTEEQGVSCLIFKLGEEDLDIIDSAYAANYEPPDEETKQGESDDSNT